MGAPSPEVLTRHKGQQPIEMDVVRRRKNPQQLRIQLAPPDEGSPDPFKAISTETGKGVTLSQRERLMAYILLGIPAPDKLTRGLETSVHIAKRKTEEKNQEPVPATDDEALESLVKTN